MTADQDKIAMQMRRLRRVEGQLRGLQGMVTRGEYCIDVLTQVLAATAALRSFALEKLGDHLSGCVLDGLRHDPEHGVEKVHEAAEAVASLCGYEALTESGRFPGGAGQHAADTY